MNLKKILSQIISFIIMEKLAYIFGILIIIILKTVHLRKIIIMELEFGIHT